MSASSEPTVLLTVRGTTTTGPGGAARDVHNQTAGSAEGVAAARALGDLSHSVYTPVDGMPGASAGELLFLDVWKDAEGIGTFFSDEQVQQGADMLFSDREAVVWMPAQGAYGFELPAPQHLTGRYLGVARGAIADPANAVEIFRKVLAPTISEARRLGQVSHQLYIKLPMPGDDGPSEAIGLDVWADPAGMGEYYQSLSGFEAAYVGPPQTSVWEQAAGGTWTEW